MKYIHPQRRGPAFTAIQRRNLTRNIDYWFHRPEANQAHLRAMIRMRDLL